LNNQDLKSIINTACKYEDTEVLEKIASSKRIQTAGVRDLLQGLGLQLSQTANESQFKDKRDLTTFIGFAGAVDDKEAAKDILEWWSKKIKEIGSDSIILDVDDNNPRSTNPTKQINFNPKNCVQLDSLAVIFDSLPPNDLNKIYGLDPRSIGTSPQPVDNKDNPPTVFDESFVDSSNNQQITFNSRSPVNLGVKFIKITNAGGNPGYLDFLTRHLNAIKPPKLSENIHVKIFNMLNSNMSDKAMSSMIRKNALAETPRAGLISNWNYIVSLPKEIETRMAKTPKTILDYKQKLALKAYGRSLSQILNTRIKFQNYAPPPTFRQNENENEIPVGTPQTNLVEGLKTEIPFYKINELSNSYFMDPDVQAQVKPLMRRLGELLDVIIPELDKDTSLTRKLIKNLITPSDYLNTRGKEFH
jgi:hypothetical protein